MTTRKELVEALRVRYQDAAVGDKVKILDEFVALTGYHRKHAIRILREKVTSNEKRARDRLYDEAVRQAPAAPLRSTARWPPGRARRAPRRSGHG